MDNRPDKPSPNRAQRRAEKSKRKRKQDMGPVINNRWYKLAMVMSIIALTALFVLNYFDEYIEPVVLISNTLWLLAAEIVITLVSLMLYRYCKAHPNFGVLETAFTLCMDKLKEHYALKNAHQIAPVLQEFLYAILLQNRRVLGLDPGPDVSALVPGQRPVYRNNAVYYVYKLIVPDPPEQGTDTLKLLLNQLIIAEFNKHGIDKLSSGFTSLEGRVYFPSVYADRVTYDEIRHTVIFEMLFVGSRTAANALTQAQERDRPKAAAPVADVFDDEI